MTDFSVSKFVLGIRGGTIGANRDFESAAARCLGPCNQALERS